MVFVEMALYTPSTNTFVDVKYITEFPDFCSAQSRVVVSPLHVLFRYFLLNFYDISWDFGKGPKFFMPHDSVS